MSLLSIRIKSLNQSQSYGQLKHDIKLKDPGYIRDRNRENIIVFNNRIHKFKIDEKSRLNGLYDDISKLHEKSRREHRKLSKEKTGRKLQQNSKSLISGIVTFSETMSEDYEKNPNLFLENMKKSMEEIEKKYNTKVLYSTIHLDEKTPHIHFMMENFNRNTGKTIQRNINRESLSELQDKMGMVWNEMGYKRGKKVEITNKKHYSVLEGHKREIEEIERDLLSKRDEIKEKKKEIKEMDILREEKTNRLNTLDNELKEVREGLKEVKTTKKNIVSQIKKDAGEIIDKSSGILGIDKELLEKNIGNVLLKYSKLSVKLRENEELSVKNEELSVKNEELQKKVYEQISINRNSVIETIETGEKLKNQQETIISLSKQKNGLIKEISDLKDEKQELQEELTEKTEIINDLVEEVKTHNPTFNYSEWKNNRKSNYDRFRGNRGLNR